MNLTIKLILLACLAGTTAVAQERTFDINSASKYFDVKVRVSKCDQDSCTGKASFSFYKKGGTVPYQVINVKDTYVDLSNGGKPLVNTTMLYDQQSVINVGDYNFDGMDDVAICNGTSGAYGSPSYDIYLSSRTAGKFVYSAALSKLGDRLGMFEVMKKEKLLQTFDKDGCCLHYTERYKVVGDRPVKVWEEIEDATIQDETKVKVTTKTLVNGRWSTSVKYVKREN
ncbi:MAG: hypothetical protein JO314_13950 [Acidobacteria bacterium]|nr:hypothetical protein [Acidobacteriota bacterium]